MSVEQLRHGNSCSGSADTIADAMTAASSALQDALRDDDRAAAAVEPGDSEMVDDAGKVSLSPEADSPGSPAAAVKLEPEDDDHSMEVDQESSAFQINDLVEISGTTRPKMNGRRGLIVSFDDVGQAPYRRHGRDGYIEARPSGPGGAGMCRALDARQPPDHKGRDALTRP